MSSLQTKLRRKGRLTFPEEVRGHQVNIREMHIVEICITGQQFAAIKEPDVDT